MMLSYVIKLESAEMAAIDGRGREMNLPLAEHIAQFTGRKARFREKRFLRHQRRKTVKRKPDNNKTAANADGVELLNK